jgi:hypothetical protein
MDIYAILGDEELKAKAKVEKISGPILDGEIDLAETIEAAKASKDPAKANCIEAIEFATKARPEIASLECLKFATETLLEKATRARGGVCQGDRKYRSPIPRQIAQCDRQPAHERRSSTHGRLMERRICFGRDR